MRAILTYHSIDGSGSPISLDRETFARHVQWMADGGVRVLGIEELLQTPDEVDAVAITFDDGFANLAGDAWPLLRERGLPATVYVVSDHVGRTNAWESDVSKGIPTLPLCGWEVLGRMAEEGLRIAVHGRRHVALDGLAPDALRDEVLDARGRIERETGRECTGFAYPYGRFDGAAVALIRETFAHACTTELRVLSGADDAHRLPRLDAYYFQAPGRIESWGSPRFRRYLGVRSIARRLRGFVRHRAVGRLGNPTGQGYHVSEAPVR